MSCSRVPSRRGSQHGRHEIVAHALLHSADKVPAAAVVVVVAVAAVAVAAGGGDRSPSDADDRVARGGRQGQLVRRLAAADGSDGCGCGGGDGRNGGGGLAVVVSARDEGQVSRGDGTGHVDGLIGAPGIGEELRTS